MIDLDKLERDIDAVAGNMIAVPKDALALLIAEGRSGQEARRSLAQLISTGVAGAALLAVIGA